MRIEELLYMAQARGALLPHSHIDEGSIANLELI